MNKVASCIHRPPRWVALPPVRRPSSTGPALNGKKCGHCLHIYPPMPISANIQCACFAFPITVVISLAVVALTRQRGNASTFEVWAASAWSGIMLDTRLDYVMPLHGQGVLPDAQATKSTSTHWPAFSTAAMGPGIANTLKSGWA